jgi:hypothetical protein
MSLIASDVILKGLLAVTDDSVDQRLNVGVVRRLNVGFVALVMTL